MRRILIALAGVATIAIPAVAAHAQDRPLSSIFSCDKPDNHQGAGAVIGGLLGGVLGNGLAGDDHRDRIAGTVIGAGLGAAVGSNVGCNMASGDGDRARDATRAALDENRSTSWSDPATGATGRIDIVNSFSRGDVAVRAPGPIESLNEVKFARDVRYPGDYDMAGERFRANERVNLKSEPDDRSEVVGALRDGETFDALARIRGGWLLAGQDGVAIGYIQARSADDRGPTSLMEYGPPAPPIDVADRQQCRTFDQVLDRPNDRETVQRFTACQNPAGDWMIQS